MSALRDVSLQDPRLRYELVQRIGSGTYGDVYKVRATAGAARPGRTAGAEGRTPGALPLPGARGGGWGGPAPCARWGGEAPLLRAVRESG